jgi:catechol 2,3-dioxygenase-like lactoylglutathione lyase family enzyme
MIKKLHHSAYRCRDSEETRKFYEGFLGLRLAGALEIKDTKSSGETDALHTFFELDDQSYLAFFEVPHLPFDFKPQGDFDLHIALEVNEKVLLEMFAKGKTEGIETRGIADHGLVHSIYFRDPNGYVVELTAKMPGHDEAMNPATNQARAILDRWQMTKPPKAAQS